jgi:predicted dehydrogenase
MNSQPLRFAMIGAGFWSQFQLAAWQELGASELGENEPRGNAQASAICVAVCDRDLRKSETLAKRMGIKSAYDNADEMMAAQSLDFVDIVTNVETHGLLAKLAFDHKLHVICQKPMAATLDLAEQMVRDADRAGVQLLVHENWRWQAPLRRLKQILDSGRLGEIVRARIDYANSFPVFDNQPFLKDLQQFILTDIGTHILDAARFLFGEAVTLDCQTRKMRSDIAGEDVATVMLRMEQGPTVICNMSYASRWQYDRFPQTMVFVEGTDAGVSLDTDYRITVFRNGAEDAQQVLPKNYAWSDPAYALIHSSIVECHRNLLKSLCGAGIAETTGSDNLRTLRLVHAAYESASTGQIIKLEYPS